MNHILLMQLSLYNTLSHKKESFTPINQDHITMYVCGPTVYDRPHLGNARSVVVYDILYRLLQHLYPKVTFVRNITDVDDKINKAAKDNGESISALATRIEALFHKDMAALNTLEPTIQPHATSHIPQIIEMITLLVDQEAAYESHGHVYFSVDYYQDYGKLSGRSTEELVAGSRIEVSEYKKQPGDFVLWKPSNEDEPGWDSPWGRGRPGWHIECSAMSTEYLGKDFDIHGGGADLQFPHHENEIAQSCCAYPDSSFANYWVHNGFLMVGGEKMSKSLGNFYTVHDLLSKGIAGEVIRFAFLMTHYRKPLDWNDKTISDAYKALDRYYHCLWTANLHDPDCKLPDVEGEVLEALCDDMNIPKVIAKMHAYAKEGNAELLMATGQLIGLLQHQPRQWLQQQQAGYSEEEKQQVKELLARRKQAKADKNWEEADKIRDELQAKGLEIQDHPNGDSTWRVLRSGS